MLKAPPGFVSQIQGKVLKMGPCGGGFGDVWEMDVRGVDRIVKLVLWHCGVVDTISVVYERDGQEEQTRQWGKAEGERSEVIPTLSHFL